MLEDLKKDQSYLIQFGTSLLVRRLFFQVLNENLMNNRKAVPM